MKENRIVIEEMRPQDTQEAYNLYANVMATSLGGLFNGWTEKRFRELYTNESFRESRLPHFTPGPDVGIFIARNLADNSIVGVGKAGIHDGKHWMDYAVVDPRYQRQGIGRALHRKRLEWHDEKDPNQKEDIYLQVHVGNPALSFHTSNGFEHVDYYQDTTTGLPKETMKLPAAKRRMLPPQAQ